MSKGLYRLDEFRDNCGFGLIAHLKGVASHGLLEKAIEALTCMTHRGGIAADGKTGDGCGLLMQKPDGFFRCLVKQELAVDLPELYAVGVIMLSQDELARDGAKAVFEKELAREKLNVVGWRVVPTNNNCLGEIALKSQPVIEQVFIVPEGDLDAVHFDARLFVARRHIEKSLAGKRIFI